jgi:iron(III) transport system ATP-binding protein
MTVEENVGYGLRVAGVPVPERRQKVDDALTLVGLVGFNRRWPATLSGGQRQRVALARCLVTAPSLVLLDEPLANLDIHLRASMHEEFAEFHRRTGTTMIYITHDQAEAMALADRIAVMDEGRIQQVATPSELFREPATEMVARFIGQGMVLRGEIKENGPDGVCAVRVLGLETSARRRNGQHTKGPCALCLRSGDLSLAADGAPGVPAQVRRAVYQGGYYRIEAVPRGMPEASLTLDIPEASAPKEGEAVRIAIRDGWVLPQNA